MAGCVLCESDYEGLGIKECGACEQVFCAVHRKDHRCLPPGENPDQDEDVPPTHHPAKTEEGEHPQHMIAGAILLATGAFLTLTFAGVLIGIPLGILGFAVMFPRFKQPIIALSAFAFVVLLALIYFP